MCIIPPDQSWDTLQRARHFAQDQSYHQWPPAIRLFYPFCDRSQISNVALDIATLVEKHSIEPFSITLNQWTVMPLPNDLKNVLEDPGEVDEADDDSPSLEKTEEDIEIMELIAHEERKGLERKRQRELRLERKRRQKAMDLGLEFEMANSTSQSATVVRPKKIENKEKVHNEKVTLQSSPQDEEFNGPAMIALEPDEKSIQKLKKLRELLRRELEGEADATGPASLWDSPVPPNNDQEEDFEAFVDDNTGFRPLIPMGAFPTIDAALSMARKLKGLWEPLTFEVTDFHFIAQPLSSSERVAAEVQSYYDSVHPNLSGMQQQRQQENAKPNTRTQFGCDALVMLVGEEIEQDEQANDLIAQIVCKEGSPGGYERREDDGLGEDEELQTLVKGGDDDITRQNHMRLFEDLERKLNADEGDFEDLLDWLEGDEEEDELEIGTSLVIGRTHMFSGETRHYDSMPALSTPDDEQAGFGIRSSSMEPPLDSFI